MNNLTDSTRTTNQPSWQASRIAVLVFFFINGAMFANWVARIPEIQSRYTLSDGELGFLLMGISAGVLTALLFVGSIINRWGSRRVTYVMAFAYCAMFPILSFMPGAVSLWAVLYVFGAIMSTMDVAMNSQAVEVEHMSGRTLMSSFHASWSIGGVFGATIGAIMVRYDLTITIHFVFVAALFAILAAMSMRYLVLQDSPTDEGDTAQGGTFRLPSRALLPLGIVALCGAIGEGAMADWSSVYLTKVVQADASVAALGFGAFALMMTVGRVSGDWVVKRISAHRIVRIGGGLAAMGLGLAIVFPQPIPTLIGFGIVGIGVSITVPLAFSAAGRMPGIPAGVGIAGVATIGYAGFFAGPPIIGLIADATSLQVSFILVAILVGSLIFTGRALKVATPPVMPADGLADAGVVT